MQYRLSTLTPWALRSPRQFKLTGMRWSDARSNHRLTSFGGLRRSELMSRVPSIGNQTTELFLLGLLREAGLVGWRRHAPIFGRPDFVWHSLHLAVFVDGCFWHGHRRCHRNLVPVTNRDLWSTKIDRNRRRDRRVSWEL